MTIPEHYAATLEAAMSVVIGQWRKDMMALAAQGNERVALRLKRQIRECVHVQDIALMSVTQGKQP